MGTLRIVLAFLTVGMAAQAGSVFCPDSSYPAVPISGIVFGEATSCGNASVDALGGFAATPGDGSVAAFELEGYLGVNLAAGMPQGYIPLEGSAVLLSFIPGGTGTTLSFSWDSMFEEGGTGALFYVLNGELTVLDVILPEGQSLPGASNDGTVTLSLLDGQNLFGFGAVTLVASNSSFPAEIRDPQLTITNLAVNQTGVPEPGTFGLMGAGLVGLVAWMRRRG